MAGQTEIAELGEFGLIERLTKEIKVKNESTKLGIGDDCAVLNHEQKDTVVTTDLLMEGVHFDLTYTPLKHLGYKAVAVNVSDVYAMNAVPKQITVSLAISAKFTVEALEVFYEGVKLACERFGVDLVGGDTSASLTGLAISITAIGELKKGTAVKRSGAKPGDLICVSGDLGGAYLGLQVLQREKKIFQQVEGSNPVLDEYGYVLERHLKPEARKDVFESLAKATIVPTAMIDISDGLSSELMHICKQSGTGCQVLETKIPIHPESENVCAEFNIEPLVPALNGGEDYELLFTISPEDLTKMQAVNDVSIIGNITDVAGEYQLASKGGQKIQLSAQGWNAFDK